MRAAALLGGHERPPAGSHAGRRHSHPSATWHSTPSCQPRKSASRDRAFGGADDEVLGDEFWLRVAGTFTVGRPPSRSCGACPCRGALFDSQRLMPTAPRIFIDSQRSSPPCPPQQSASTAPPLASSPPHAVSPLVDVPAGGILAPRSNGGRQVLPPSDDHGQHRPDRQVVLSCSGRSRDVERAAYSPRTAYKKMSA